MRGFTTVRDLGGPAFALKQAIDGGLVSGPRIYPSGAMITATGGHGDLRPLSDVPSVGGSLSRIEQTGGSIIADGSEACGCAFASSSCRARPRLSWRGAAASLRRAAPSRRSPSPNPNCARQSKPRKTGLPTSRCTLSRRVQCSESNDRVRCTWPLRQREPCGLGFSKLPELIDALENRCTPCLDPPGKGRISPFRVPGGGRNYNQKSHVLSSALRPPPAVCRVGTSVTRFQIRLGSR